MYDSQQIGFNIATEEEVFLVQDGVPYLFRHQVLCDPSELNAFGVSYELGPSQAEVHTGVCQTSAELTSSLAQGRSALRAVLPDRVDVRYAQYMPEFAPDPQMLLVDETLPPRIHAILRGLQREDPTRWAHVNQLGCAQALQFHIGITVHDVPAVLDVAHDSSEVRFAVFLVNMLNNMAPYIAHQLAVRYGLPSTAERLQVWHGYCKRWRRPEYQWRDGDSVRTWYRNTPRLVAVLPGKDDSQFAHWEVLPDACMQHDDWLDVSLCRNLVKLCPPTVSKPVWTLEFRAFSTSSDLGYVAEAADLLLGICRALADNWDDGRYCSVQSAQPSFAFLHAKFGAIVPPKPVSEEVWYTLNDVSVPR